MKRKKSFTKTEVEQIKKLIAEKINATSDKQKGIRDKIRKIGFHYSDFSSKKSGYTVTDFEALISSGVVEIIEVDVKPTFPAEISKSIRRSISRITNDNPLSNHIKNSFEPIIDNSTEILILGSMPGDYSLSIGEYYAHSGNRFWKIIARITNDKIPTLYNEKRDLLKKYKIGLWDVAKMANRKGSLDSNISAEMPNNLNELLNAHPKIKVVGLNGGKAANLFNKFFDKQTHIVYYNLSSTSGANTSLTFEESCKDWQRIFK